jgi:hypothetical protein
MNADDPRTMIPFWIGVVPVPVRRGIIRRADVAIAVERRL